MAAENSIPPQSAVEDSSPPHPIEYVTAILSTPQPFREFISFRKV